MTEPKRRTTTARTSTGKKTQKAEVSQRRGRLSEADKNWVVPQALKRGYARPRIVDEGEDR